jgi:hypothetical protein
VEVNVAKKTETLEARLQIALTSEEKDRLQELANVNTGENMSLLVRRMLELAWSSPESLGLYPPKGVALVSMN